MTVPASSAPSIYPPPWGAGQSLQPQPGGPSGWPGEGHGKIPAFRTDGREGVPACWGWETFALPPSERTYRPGGHRSPWSARSGNSVGPHGIAPLAAARIAALVAAGRAGQARTSSASSGSSEGSRAPSAPDSAPPLSRNPGFPEVFEGCSRPVPATNDSGRFSPQPAASSRTPSKPRGSVVSWPVVAAAGCTAFCTAGPESCAACIVGLLALRACESWDSNDLEAVENRQALPGDE